jgi:hypothetical protein
MERTKPEPGPSGDPKSSRDRGKTPGNDHGTRPQSPPQKVKVTPLDEDKNIEKGIEVDET